MMAENQSLIEEVISAQWGDRCPDFDKDCACCQVWAAYDALASRDVTEEPVAWSSKDQLDCAKAYTAAMAMWGSRREEYRATIPLYASPEHIEKRTSSTAWQKSCADMHRRAQKAEGIHRAIRNILHGWRETYLSHPKERESFIIRDMIEEMEKKTATFSDREHGKVTE